MRFDKDEIRFAARANPRLLFDAYGRKSKRSAGQLESSYCPVCGDHSRRALLFHPVKLLWNCKVCGAGGDLFDFIGSADSLPTFPQRVARAAEIFSVPPDTAGDEERERAKLHRAQRAHELEKRWREEEARRAATEHPRSLRYWERLLQNHDDGQRYLEQRGLADALKLVRFDNVETVTADFRGAPALPLFASDGRIKNVIRRPIQPGEKPIGINGCSTAGTMVNALPEITDQARDVIIAEGLADALTAKVAYHHLGALVLGAHGAGNLEKIVRMAAPRVSAARGRLRIAPHRDRAGYAEAMRAAQAATKAGLSTHRGTLEIVDTGAKDLNEAWCAGWRAA